MIFIWTVQYHFAICGSDDMQCRSTFSTEAHSVILLNNLYMDGSVSSGFTNFAFCGSDDMYNTLYTCFIASISIITFINLMGVF